MQREATNPAFAFLWPGQPHHDLFRRCLLESLGAGSDAALYPSVAPEGERPPCCPRGWVTAGRHS